MQSNEKLHGKYFELPNLKSLGIRVIIGQRDANNNDNEQVLDHP